MPSEAPQPVSESSGEHLISSVPPKQFVTQDDLRLALMNLHSIIRHIDKRLSALEKILAVPHD